MSRTGSKLGMPNVEEYELLDLGSGGSILLGPRRGWKVAMLCDATEEVGTRWRGLGQTVKGASNFHPHFVPQPPRTAH